MLYWQRLFTLSTQSLEFSLVNEFSVPSSGPHCGLKGLFFSELLCFLPLAHLIQTCESYSPETWTSQRCFQARKLSVERHSARAQKPRPPPRRLPALAASIATPLTCHCVQPLSLGSGGFPLSRVSFLLCQVERKEILGIENIIFKDREVGNALSEKATPLRGMSLQSLGQRSLTTLHKALSVSPNSSCFPCQVRGGQLRPRAHPLLQHPHQLPGLHAACRPLRRAALRVRLRAAPPARQRRELQRECRHGGPRGCRFRFRPRSFISRVFPAPFSLL